MRSVGGSFRFKAMRSVQAPHRQFAEPTPDQSASRIWLTCQHDQTEQGPTEPHTGRSTFLLSLGGAGGGRVLLSGLWCGADRCRAPVSPAKRWWHVCPPFRALGATALVRGLTFRRTAGRQEARRRGARTSPSPDTCVWRRAGGAAPNTGPAARAPCYPTTPGHTPCAVLPRISRPRHWTTLGSGPAARSKFDGGLRLTAPGQGQGQPGLADRNQRILFSLRTARGHRWQDSCNRRRLTLNRRRRRLALDRWRSANDRPQLLTGWALFGGSSVPGAGPFVLQSEGQPRGQPCPRATLLGFGLVSFCALIDCGGPPLCRAALISNTKHFPLESGGCTAHMTRATLVTFMARVDGLLCASGRPLPPPAASVSGAPGVPFWGRGRGFACWLSIPRGGGGGG